MTSCSLGRFWRALPSLPSFFVERWLNEERRAFILVKERSSRFDGKINSDVLLTLRIEISIRMNDLAEERTVVVPRPSGHNSLKIDFEQSFTGTALP